MTSVTASVEAALASAHPRPKAKSTLSSVIARAGAPRSATTAAAQALAASSSPAVTFNDALKAALLREAAAAELAATSIKPLGPSSPRAFATAVGAAGEAAAGWAGLPEDVLDPESLDMQVIRSALSELDAQEASLDSDLACLRAEAASAVGSALPDLAFAESEARRVVSMVDALFAATEATAGLVANSASAIAALQHRKAELRATLELVHRLLELDAAEAAAAAALAASDYEAAAEQVRTALSSVRAAGEAIDGTARSRVEAAHARVLSAVRARLSDALASGTLGPCCRFCRLLSRLGETGEARATLAAFCHRQVEAAVAMTPAEQDQPVLATVPLRMARLLRATAEAVAGVAVALAPNGEARDGNVNHGNAGDGEFNDENSRDGKASDGKGSDGKGRDGKARDGHAANGKANDGHANDGTPTDGKAVVDSVNLCAELYSRSVDLGSGMASQYAAACAMRSKSSAARRRMGAAVPVGQLPEIGPDAEAEALGCEGLLDEIAGMLRGATQYDAFMAARGIVPANQGKGPAGQGEGPAGWQEKGPGAGTLGGSPGLADLRSGLQALSAQQAWAGLVKAMRVDASLEDEAARPGRGMDETDRRADMSKSELLDSVFYLLQKYLRRAARTCDGETAAAAVRMAAKLIGGFLLDALCTPLKQTVSAKLAGAALASAQAMMAEASTGVSGAMGSAVSAAGAARLPGTLRALNAVQLCLSCTPRLFRAAAEECGRELPPPAMAAVAAELEAARRVEEALGTALTSGLQQLGSTIHPRLKPRLDAFRDRSYLLQSDEALATAEAASFVSPLLAEMSAALSALQPGLNEPNRQALLLLLVGHCADRIEALLLLKKVDLFGALQLERDVRALGQRLSALSSRSVREPLSRLTQMATLLSLERESELLDLWAHGSLKLTAREARQVMALRVEFHPDAIARLPLPG
jgi:hypothetical protein